MASFLVYNGIALDVMRTLTFAQEPVIANGDLVGIRVVLEVEAVYNPSATSYILGAVNGTTGAIPVQGVNAPATSVAIDRFLQVPRASLVYVVGGTVVLQSPAPGVALGLAIDIDSGPTPLGVQVRPGLTERTWRVVFRVSTVINDCNPVTPGLLSNRWTQTHTVGADHLTTVVTEGVTIFRSDVLANLGVTADYFRSVCLPPHLYDFQRVETVVRLNEVGNALTWRVTDRERFVSIGLQTGRAYGVIDFQANVKFYTPTTGDPATGVAMPVVVGQFIGMARGDRNSSRAGLFSWLSRLAAERMGIPPYGITAGDTPIKVAVSADESIDAPIVSLAVTARYPSPKEITADTDAMLKGFLGIDVLPLFQEGLLAGTNPQAPAGARGHYRGMAFSQTLKSALAFCTPPQRPLAAVNVPGRGVPDASGIPGIWEDSYLSGSKPLVDVAVGPPLPSPRIRTRRSLRKDNEGLQEQKSTVSHVTVQNRVVAPVASREPAEPLVFQLAQPISFRRADWSTERVGAKPKIPPIKSGDPKEVAVAGHAQFATPVVGPDMQNLIYRAAGHAVWAYTGQGSRGPGDAGLAMGAHPWMETYYGTPETTVAPEDYLVEKGWVAPPNYTPPPPTPGPTPPAPPGPGQ